MPIKTDWKYKDYISLDETIERPSYNVELEMYEAIKNGKLDFLEKDLKEHPFMPREGWGVLSSNKLRNHIYHFIITVALIARFCIEGGMDINDAYSLSDYYIQKSDRVSSHEEIVKLHRDMVMDYANKMKRIETKDVFSKQIVKAIDYINNHLYENIKISDVADYIGLNQFYLSSLFKQETNINLKDFILTKKIETAKNMIDYSEYSFAEISNSLGFCSQSYFISSFKKLTGMTPKDYQDSGKQKLSKKA